MTRSELAAYADVRERDVAPALSIMEKLGMTCENDGVIRVCNWGSRQYESDDVSSRTRAYRERSKERSNDVPRNVPVGTGENVAVNVRRNGPDTETDTDTEKDLTTTAPLADASTAATSKRGHRIPGDWAPSEHLLAWARDNGLAEAVIAMETDNFRDYWQAKAGADATKLDWDKTWRTWMRKRMTGGPALAYPTRRSQQEINQATLALLDGAVDPFAIEGGSK